MMRLCIIICILICTSYTYVHSQEFWKDTLWSTTIPKAGNISAKLLFHPDGKSLFVTSDEALYQYDCSNGKLVSTRLSQSGSAIIDYHISRDTQTLYLLTRRFLEIWHIENGFLRKFPLRHQGVTSFSISTDGLTAFIGYYNRGLEKMSLSNGEILMSTNEVGYEISLNPDNSDIVCFYAPMTHRTSIVSAENLRIIHTLPPTTHTPMYSSDGKYIIGIGSNNTVSIYDTKEEKQYYLPGHKGKITGICFDNTGKYILTSSMYEPETNFGYRIWSIEKKELFINGQPELNGRKIAHSPVDSLFALSSGDTGRIIVCRHETLP